MIKEYQKQAIKAKEKTKKRGNVNPSPIPTIHQFTRNLQITAEWYKRIYEGVA
jgi:hypothetical protein